MIYLTAISYRKVCMYNAVKFSNDLIVLAGASVVINAWYKRISYFRFEI